MKNKIRMFVMDVDGTLTDGKIYVGIEGEMLKAFDVHDGYAIHEILPQKNVVTVIITGRISQIVENRARELEVKEVFQGVNNKLEILKELSEKYGCNATEIAYIGDDIIDKESMEWSGISACPSDAVGDIKIIADYVCKHEGGNGAVREFVEWLLEEKTC